METRGIERLLLRDTEGAQVLGIGRTKLREMMDAGEIRSITIGRSRRIPVEALKEWLDRRLREESNESTEAA